MPGLQVMVYVSKAASTAVLRASGKEHVFTRDFYESDEDRAKYRIVPSQEGSSLAAALEQAAHMGEDAFGVVQTKKGFGIRVRSDQYENVLMRLRPDDAQQFLVDRWRSQGCQQRPERKQSKSLWRGGTCIRCSLSGRDGDERGSYGRRVRLNRGWWRTRRASRSSRNTSPNPDLEAK